MSVYGGLWGGLSGGKKEGILTGEEDESIYEDSIMKPTKYCLKREEREWGMEV
jgi:hypothetical protein